MRADLHLLVKELAQGDIEDAAAHVGGLGVADLKAAAEAFAADKGHPIRFTIDARAPGRTLLQKEAERRYRVRQLLVDDAGDDDWAIEAEIDLGARQSASDPLLTLVRIGR